MKKKTIAAGIVLVILTAGIWFWGAQQAEEARIYREKTAVVQSDITELEDKIAGEQKQIEEIDLDGIKAEIEKSKKAAADGLDEVKKIFYSDDIIDRNIMLYDNLSMYMNVPYEYIDDLNDFDFNRLPDITGNEMVFPDGMRFVSGDENRNVLRLAGFYYISYVVENRIYSFKELDGWTVMFTDADLEQMEGEVCQDEEHIICVLDAERKTVCISQSDFSSKDLFHSLSHIIVLENSDDKEFQEAEDRLFARRYEYKGALMTPDLHLADREAFMVEMIQGMICSNINYDLFDYEIDAGIFFIRGMGEEQSDEN